MDVSVSVMRRGGLIWVAMIILAGLSVASSQSVDQITVQSVRDREKLKHDLDVFVSSAIVSAQNYGDSLWRWNKEICPLVAGLNKQGGEFVLARLSQIAKTVGAPLGPETCKPNFFVIMTSDPEMLLNKWWHRSVDLFDGEAGADVKRFIVTPRPIRVWYSASTVAADVNFVIGLLDATSVRAHPFHEPIVNRQPSFLGSRLTVSATRNIISVIIVIDTNKVSGLSFGQLADYMGFVGLAQINLDKPVGDAPTILKLFTTPPGARPAEMTDWDRALLHGLYSTAQTNRMQKSQIETVALRDIESKPVR